MAFTKLPNLEKLDLSGNSITSIASDAFRMNSKLKEIKLDGNPLNCKCTMLELKRWSEQKGVRLTKAKCANRLWNDLSAMSDNEFGNCVVTGPAVMTAKAPKNCMTGWQRHGASGPYFQYVTDTVRTYEEAQKTCVSLGSQLASIHSEEENDFLRDWIKNCHDPPYDNQNKMAWLGARDLQNKVDELTWNDGSDFDYKNTGRVTLDGQEERCVAFKFRIDFGWEWNDMSCRSRMNTLCKRGRVKIICEHKQGTLTCEKGSKINIISSNYGRTQQSVCTKGIPASQAKKTDCIESRSLEKLRKTCNGKSSCTLRASNTIFGDPCHGTFKYLDVEYGCTSVETACQKTFESTLKGNFTWPETPVGQTARVLCPKQPRRASGRQKLARRSCVFMTSGKPYWQTSDLSECGYTSEVTIELQDLANKKVTQANVVQVTEDLAAISSEVDEFSFVDVALTADNIDNILKSDTAFTSASVQNKTARNLARTVSNVMKADTDTLATAEQVEGNSVTKLVGLVEKLSKSLGAFESGKSSFVESNLALAVVDSKEASAGDISIVLRHMDDDDELTDDKVYIQTGGNLREEHTDTYLTIPREVAMMYQKETTNFVMYGKDTLFRVIDKKPKDSKPPRATTNSRVVSANIGDQIVKNLATPITLHFDYINKTGYSNPRCVFWDLSSEKWSDEGCRLLGTHSDGVSCECDHLTSFALLMDLTGDVGGLDSTQMLIQSILTYLGCSLSLIALVFTVFTYFFFSAELLRENPSRILINLCISIIGTNLVFICGSHHRVDDVGCKVIAILLHYTILASFCWMSVEAFYMYLALIKVFQPYWPKLILKLAIFGWGFPFIPVAITIGINRDNYGLQGLCWLRPIPLLAAFVAPACLMLLFNFVIFGMVMWKLIGSNKRSILTKTDKKSTSTQLRGAASVVVLLGLTWTFGLLNIEGAAVVFSYLFIICNTLQGVFIFLFYCLWKKQARNAWAKKCGCRISEKDKYKSNTSTSKGSTGQGIDSIGLNKSNGKGKNGTSAASFSSATTLSDFDATVSNKGYMIMNHEKIKEPVVLKPTRRKESDTAA